MNRPEDKARVALEEIGMEAHALGASYAEADAAEDAAVERLLAFSRGLVAASPLHLRKLDQWEREWRGYDARADGQVEQGSAEIAQLVAMGERYPVSVAPLGEPAFFSAHRGTEKVETLAAVAG